MTGIGLIIVFVLAIALMIYSISKLKIVRSNGKYSLLFCKAFSCTHHTAKSFPLLFFRSKRTCSERYTKS